MATRRPKRVAAYERTQPTFDVDSCFWWNAQGLPLLVRVLEINRDDVVGETLRGGQRVRFPLKRAQATRALISPAEAERLLGKMRALPDDVTRDREQRLYEGIAATKGLDPFEKADVYVDLARLRANGSGFWADDKRLYLQLRELLIDELALVLGLTEAEVEARVDPLVDG